MIQSQAVLATLPGSCLGLVSHIIPNRNSIHAFIAR
jgi:hypothetical protein